MKTPKQLGYYFPAEWEKHDAMWLSWIHNEDSFPGTIHKVYPYYCEFIKEVSKSEMVRINVADETMKQFAIRELQKINTDLQNIEFYFNPTNDAWCRDHGPAFLVNKEKNKKAIVNWNYNAWGNKYPPFDLDNEIPTRIAQEFDLEVFSPNIIMEGGSVEFNGKGTILTSRSCLLNKNRNPHLNQDKIENYLLDYYGQEQVVWVSDGIVGDDTDGHIDDTVRFVNHNTVLTVVEENKSDENYEILQQNLRELKQIRLLNDDYLNIVELPMPKPVVYEGQRLPASYANFYIANHAVIVPTFRCSNDDKALQIIQDCFKNRKVVGIDSTEIIWGLGSFHCLSQQEPSL
ncbi:MAG: agmatine deiminase family protein [Flavobacteriales bacterium]|nr:agmatine deiminase family protein [Flavobacteriales bacterium]